MVTSSLFSSHVPWVSRCFTVLPCYWCHRLHRKTGAARRAKISRWRAESLVPGRLLGLLLLDGNFCWISVITNEFRTLLLWVCLLFVHTFYPSGQVSSFTNKNRWELMRVLGLYYPFYIGNCHRQGNSNHFLGIVPEAVDISQVVVPKLSRIIQQLLGFNIKPRNHKP